MDNGEVIVGLNEDWNLGGAKIGEWVGGFMMFIIASELLFTNIGRNMPWLMLIWVSTTFGMSALRRSFPDEEGPYERWYDSRGISSPRNPGSCGSSALLERSPTEKFKKDSVLVQLGLDQIIFTEEDEVTETES